MGDIVKKVLIVHNGIFGSNGISEMINNSVNFLVKDTDLSISVLVNGDEIEEKYKKNFERNDIKIFYVKKKQKNLLNYWKDLKIVSKKDFDVVHIHGNSGMMGLEVAAFKKKGRKIITHIHNTRTDYGVIEKFFKYFVLKYSNVRFSASQLAGEKLYGSKDFAVIPNGIDVNNFQYSEESKEKVKQSIGISNELVILHIGRFSEQKNHHKIINIFSELKKIEPSSKLILIGDGELKKEIEDFSEKSNLINDIEFIGETNKVSDYYNLSDIFLLPSLYEAFPVTLIEAQASGLNCLVSKESVGKEVNITGLVSFMSLDDTDKKWAEEIIKVVKTKNVNREKYANIISEKNYSIENSYIKIKKEYKN